MGGKYDAVIVGAGHNALVTAGYLAKKGKKVAVLEKNDKIGGCTSTDVVKFDNEEFKFAPASYVISLFQPGIVRDFQLKKHGFEIFLRKPASYTPDLEGPGLVLGKHPNGRDLSYEEISRYSESDAKNFKIYESDLEEVVKKLEPMIESPIPNLGFAKSIDKNNFLFKGMRALPSLLQLLPESSFGEGAGFASELIFDAAMPIIDRYFESDILKATLATDAVIGAMTSASQQGSAYVLLHHVMGNLTGERGVWGYVKGGMGGLADSLESYCLSTGNVDIFTNKSVDEICVDKNKVKGVLTSDGNFYETNVAASSVDCNLTFNKFLRNADIPLEFLNEVERIRYDSASMKLNFALSELPKFSSDGSVQRDYNPLTGTIHVPNSVLEVERAFDDAKYGIPSKRPILEMTIPSILDNTLAPEGKHVMGIFVQYAPYSLSHEKGAEGWDDIKEDFADTCESLIEEYAPGFKSSIIGRQIVTPLDLERRFGLTGGNIFQGVMNFNNMGPLRPVLGYSDHSTPVKGLYMCGASTHPGGGVLGTNGKNAAIKILKDKKF